MAPSSGDNGSVANFAGVFAWTDEGWTGAEVDLAEVMTIEDIADQMREAAVEFGADTVVLLVADDDRWFGIVRLTGQAEPRVFLSDSRAASSPATDRLAALLYAHAGKAGKVATAPDGTATGDPDLLSDLGTDAATLVELSKRTAAADALAAIADRVGMSDAYARLD